MELVMGTHWLILGAVELLRLYVWVLVSNLTLRVEVCVPSAERATNRKVAVFLILRKYISRRSLIFLEDPYEPLDPCDSWIFHKLRSSRLKFLPVARLVDAYAEKNVTYYIYGCTELPRERAFM